MNRLFASFSLCWALVSCKKEAITTPISIPVFTGILKNMDENPGYWSYLGGEDCGKKGFKVKVKNG